MRSALGGDGGCHVIAADARPWREPRPRAAPHRKWREAAAALGSVTGGVAFAAVTEAKCALCEGKDEAQAQQVLAAAPLPRRRCREADRRAAREGQPMVGERRGGEQDEACHLSSFCSRYKKKIVSLKRFEQFGTYFLFGLLRRAFQYCWDTAPG